MVQKIGTKNTGKKTISSLSSTLVDRSAPSPIQKKIICSCIVEVHICSYQLLSSCFAAFPSQPCYRPKTYLTVFRTKKGLETQSCENPCSSWSHVWKRPSLPELRTHAFPEGFRSKFALTNNMTKSWLVDRNLLKITWLSFYHKNIVVAWYWLIKIHLKFGMLVGWLIKIGMISLVFCDRGNRGSPKFNHARRAYPNLAVWIFLILSRLLLCSRCDLTSRIYTPVNSHSNPDAPCREYLPRFSSKMWPFFT